MHAVRLIDWHFPEVCKSIDLNENKHDASSICIVCSWKSRVSVTWPPWRHNKTIDLHGSVTTGTKLNRKWSGKSVLKHAEWVCCSWLQWKVDKGVLFPCFSLNFVFVFKWSQIMTVANGNESMRKKWEPKHHDVLCSKHFQKKNASQIAPCWAFSLGSNTCPQVTDLERFPVWISKAEAPTPLPVVGCLFISPLSFHLSRALLGAWRFGLFRSVYSSFHNRLDHIREPAFYWVFYFPSLSMFVSSYVKMKKFCSF